MCVCVYLWIYPIMTFNDLIGDGHYILEKHMAIKMCTFIIRKMGAIHKLRVNKQGGKVNVTT